MPGGHCGVVSALVVGLIGGAAACGSGPAGPVDAEPSGIDISLNGSVVVRAEGDRVEGVLHLHVDQYSGRFIITPTAGEGRAITEPERYALTATIANEGVATFVAAAPGAFEGEFVAHADGGTTISFVLRDGTDPTVVAYRTPPIDVVATSCIIGLAAQSRRC